MSIQIILGPMFSGKTTELLRRIRRYSVSQRKCMLIKYDKDMRYDAEQVATHDKYMMQATPASRLFNEKEKAMGCQVIGIDEGQFFPDLVEFCEEMANAGKTVIVAALDGTFERKPFGRIPELIPLAEDVVKLRAICMKCFEEAPFSQRISAETETEVIGGADKYISCCRKCFHLPMVVPPEQKKSINELPKTVTFVKKMNKSWKVTLSSNIKYYNDREPHVETDIINLERMVCTLGRRRQISLSNGRVAITYELNEFRIAKIPHLTTYVGPIKGSEEY